MGSFVIDPDTRCGSGFRKPVDRYPGQNLVVGPPVAVGPVVQLFENPGQEGGRTVSECIADGLGFGALKEVVSITLIHEPC